jgi:serine/threonine-protein kinase RsbW
VIETRLIQVPTDLEALAQVLLWFDQQYEAHIPDRVWMQCQIALAEGFTNAVRHAHRERSSDTPITIEVEISEQSLSIRVWDFGPAFDLQKAISELAQQVDPQAEGGRGLHLIHKIADQLSYTRTSDERNCLLIFKNYVTAT